MTNQIIAALLLTLCCLDAKGIPSRLAQEERREYRSLHSSTGIKVLLDKLRRSLVVRSPMDRLHARESDSGAWFPIDRSVTIGIAVSEKKTKTLSLNGKILNRNFLYIRGGARPSDLLQYRGGFFRGTIKVTLSNDILHVINHLPLEDYLEGTLPSEMSPSWPMEALKAQAVASRTYALFMQSRPKNRLYDLDGTILDQVYNGVTVGNRRALLAIRETAGQFLTQGNGPIKAFFHSRCGGMTEAPRTVWSPSENRPAKAFVPCPYCQKNPYTWKASVALKEVLDHLGPSLEGQTLVEMVPERISTTGRIASLKVKTDKDEHVLSTDEFRNLIGYGRIKSALFSWKIVNGSIFFEGKGAGHGVGLCQWGTRHFAENGKTYLQILKHYYPQASLAKLGELSLPPS